MQEFLHYLISSIVDDTDSITIDEEKEDGVVRFNVSLATLDYGKVIGKGGKTVNALKNLLYVYRAKTEELPQQIFINVR